MRLRYFLSALAVSVVGVSALCAGTAKAQISLTTGSSLYTQNFDTLALGNTSSAPYTDNSTIPGLYSLIGKGPLGTGAATSTPTLYYVSNGSSVTAGINDFGINYNSNDPNSTNRAFGTFVNDATTGFDTGFIAYGFRFVNNDSLTITQFTVQYTGEQWRRNTTTNQTLAFSSAVFDSGTGGLDPTTGYTSNTALDYLSTPK